MSNDTEWESWMNAWRTGPARLPQLAGHVQRERRRQARAVAVEWLAGLAVLLFWAWAARREPTPVILTLAGLSAALTAAWLASLVRTLRGTWKEAGVSTHAFLVLTRDRRRARVRWFRFVQHVLLVLAVLPLAWGPWLVQSRWEMYRAEPWRAFVGFGVYYAVLVVLHLQMRRQKAQASRELEGAEALLAELEAD